MSNGMKMSQFPHKGQFRLRLEPRDTICNISAGCVFFFYVRSHSGIIMRGDRQKTVFIFFVIFKEIGVVL